MKIVAAGQTDIGKKRKANQDSFRMDEENTFYIVADGMGGHAGGELASKITVDTIAEYLVHDKEATSSQTPQDLIIGAIHRANAAVYSQAQENPKLRGMGTTVLVLYFEKDMMYIGHVGDSRVYFVRGNEIWQLTRDHSLVNEKFKAGIITRDQMRSDKSKNVITRSVGFESSVLADIYQKQIQPGDFYLACSDGLSGMLEDQQILEILKSKLAATRDLSKAVKSLIEEANANGGDDNITLVIAHALA